MHIRASILSATKRLLEARIDNPAMEARILLGFALKKSIEYLLARPEYELAQKELELFESYLQRRLLFEPIAYITGKKEFFGRDFAVTRNTLIPRPDSETLIESALLLSDERQRDPRVLGAQASHETFEGPRPRATTILELGVGSGCLIITLLLEMPNTRGIGIDIDPNTLAIARHNAKTHKIDNKLELIESNWFSNIQEQKFDIIISNPPYIDSTDHVAKETMLYEPHKALFGGLATYQAIASGARDFMKPDGRLYLEIGYNQRELVIELFKKNGYELIKAERDLADHVRCLVFAL
jgi:release factor glutamine methyltransferase